MRACDFVITLYSFVYALAVAQILSAVGDMIRAGKRLRFSWINAGSMLKVLLAIVAWWLRFTRRISERLVLHPLSQVSFGMLCDREHRSLSMVTS
jgi:hypothetical protein